MKLNERMKNYEAIHQHSLTPGVSVIVKVKGRFFNKLTKGLVDIQEEFMTAMLHSSLETIKEMEGVELAYIHNDEVIFLITDFTLLQTQSWFNYNISKIISITSAKFNIEFNNKFKHKDNDVLFYVSCFNIPIHDVPNYFIWRQKDCQRNSLQDYCRQFFSDEEMHGVKVKYLKLMLNKKDKDWEKDVSLSRRNGVFMTYNRGVIKSNSKII